MNSLGLAIEGGGSKTHFVLIRDDGAVVARDECGPSSRLYLRESRARAAFEAALDRIAAHGKSVVDHVALAGPMSVPEVSGLVHARWLAATVHPCAEFEVALAVHDLEWGLGLIAGTGSSCCGRNERGDVACSGGYGPQFGDEGSGYWIACLAVRAVAYAGDGRGPQTSLTRAFQSYFKSPDRWDVFQRVDSNGHLPVQEVAGFAPHVFEAAGSGDGVAKLVCNAAGEALASLLFATSAKLNFDSSPVPVVPSGGVFRAGPLVLDAIQDALGEHAETFRFLPAVAAPVDGLVKRLLHHMRERE